MEFKMIMQAIEWNKDKRTAIDVFFEVCLVFDK